MIHFNRTALSLFLVIIMIFQFVPANAEPAAYTVNIEFDIIRILTKQSLVLYIDGKKTKTMEPGAKDLKLTLAPGNHTFKFSTEKDSDISDKITLNIRGDGKYRFTISYTGLSVVAIHRLIEGNKPASSQSTSQKSSKAFPIEALDAYNFSREASTSETGHKYRYTEKYYFDLLNNVLVRTWEKRSGNKNTSGYDVYALVTKNGKVYAYDSDGEKSLCFEILDKDIMYPLEGYLYADTYFVTTDNSTIEGFTEMCLDRMDEELSDRRPAIDASGFTVHQLLTLTSIVTKEATADDQAGVAGVFMNRLDQGMSLGSDVTVCYIFQEDRVDLKVSQLESENPYNTRKYAGLPPGPICQVVGDAIDATLNYEKHDYLFFIADEQGIVRYSTDEAGHESNIDEHGLVQDEEAEG